MILLACLNWLAAGALVHAAEIDRVDGGTIHFKTAEGEAKLEPLKTGLANPKALGLLRPEGSPPYVVVLDDQALHLVRADGAKKLEFTRPGRITDPATGVKVLDSEGFFGRCVPGQGDVFVAYQTEVVDRKRRKRKTRVTEPSIVIAEPSKEGVQEKLQELRSLGSLAHKKRETLRRVKSKQCFAIEGLNRQVSANLISLRSKRDVEEDEDETPSRDDADGPAEGAAPSEKPEKTAAARPVPSGGP